MSNSSIISKSFEKDLIELFKKYGATVIGIHFDMRTPGTDINDEIKIEFYREYREYTEGIKDEVD